MNVNQLQMMNDYRFEREQNIIIDCFGSSEISKSGLIPDLLLIEDCRENTSSVRLTQEDFQRENVIFVRVEINHWPGIFVCAKRNINADEKICGYYGPQYGRLKREADMQNKSVGNYVSSICQFLENRC